VHRDAESVSNKYRGTLKLLETHQKAFKQTENSTQQARERDGAGCVICRPFHSPSITCSCHYCGTLSSTPPPPFIHSWPSLMTIFDVLKKCLATTLHGRLQHLMNFICRTKWYCYTRIETSVEYSLVITASAVFPFIGCCRMFICQKCSTGNKIFSYALCVVIDPIQTKCWPLYLKTQSVPRCKHFSSRL